MLRSWAALGLLVLTLTPLAAQTHSKEDELACRPDVFRLCAGEIPNRGRIIACMERRRAQLSPACAEAFERSRPAAASASRSAAQPTQFDGPGRWGR